MERPGAQELEGRFEFSWIKRNTEAILGKKRNERGEKKKHCSYKKLSKE